MFHATCIDENTRKTADFESSQPARKQGVWSTQEDKLLAALTHLGPASVGRKQAAAGRRPQSRCG